jgi:hypothetical protein
VFLNLWCLCFIFKRVDVQVWDCTTNTFLHRLWSTTSSNTLCQLVHMESSVHWPWLPPQGIHLLLNVFNCLVSGFRLLGIFMFNLIWKNHRKLMTTNMCRCEILLIALVAKIYMTNTFIIANILLNWIHSVRDVYPAEEPRVNAPMAPCALADIVRCSKLWITVDARRCS